MNIIQIALSCAAAAFLLCGCFGFIALGAARLIEAKARLVEAQREPDVEAIAKELLHKHADIWRSLANK